MLSGGNFIVTEAVDKLDEIKRIVKKYAISNYYIHCDAAFLGAFAPFVKDRPNFYFSHGVDSVSISGHKFIGGPIPCGIVLVKRQHRNRIANTISYVDTMDTTITGSRNGLTPLFLWSFIQKNGIDGIKKRAEQAQLFARYTEIELNKINCNAWRNNDALTVIFDRPSDSIVKQFQLATDDEISHVICIPGITKQQIDALVLAIKSDKKTNEESYNKAEKINHYIHS